jgi:hypothetical protein
MKMKVCLEPNGYKEVEGTLVKLAIPKGLPPMEFYAHEAIGRGGYDVTEFRTGRVASLKRDMLFPPEFETVEAAVKQAEGLIQASVTKLKKNYPRMKTINFDTTGL